MPFSNLHSKGRNRPSNLKLKRYRPPSHAYPFAPKSGPLKSHEITQCDIHHKTFQFLSLPQLSALACSVFRRETTGLCLVEKVAVSLPDMPDTPPGQTVLVFRYTLFFSSPLMRTLALNRGRGAQRRGNCQQAKRVGSGRLKCGVRLAVREYAHGRTHQGAATQRSLCPAERFLSSGMPTPLHRILQPPHLME